MLRLDVPPLPHPGNPLFPLGGAGSWREEQIFDFCPLPDPTDAAKLLMYATGMAAPVASGTMSIGRYTGTVAAPYTWADTGQVLLPAASGWDAGHVRLGSVVYTAGTYYLFYTGGTPGSGTSIGLATSTNGASFTRHPSNPILTPTGQGRNDGDHVSEPAVLLEGGQWTLIYGYRNGGTTLPGYRYATSTNGTSWAKGGTGDILTTAPLYGEFHQILKVDDKYVLIYESGSGTVPYRIFAAIGPAASGPFTPLPTGPILRESGLVGAWDRYHVATASVLQVSGQWLLFYCAAGTMDQPYVNNTWPGGIATFVPRAFAGRGRRR